MQRGFRAMSSKILYNHQSQLPRLIVPTLKETTDKYLASIKPLCGPEDYKRNQALCQELIESDIGKTLQERLEKRQQTAKNSWLIDWWNDYAYMSYRDPVVINVNYFFAFVDDPLRRDPAVRAANIVQGAMQFRDLVVNETLEPDATKQGPLCMQQYKFMFNSTRIPEIPSDITRTSDPEQNQFIIVMRHNQFYKLDLLVDGQRLSTDELVAQFQQIYKLAGTKKDDPVGLFTTENRDVWTQIRKDVLAVSKVNQESLDLIERAAFVVCLDDSKPVTKEEISRACWHGDGRNRFFDKSLQFIIFDNGKAGFNGEHSMMDATPTSRLCEYVCESIATGKVNHGSSKRELAFPRKLQFEWTPKLKQQLVQAGQQFDQVIDKHDLQVVVFEAYGKNLIKKLGVSPDAYAQMAIQLAYYKMYGVCRATYESAQTKKYEWGRTETCRSVSVESAAWVRAMQDPHLDLKTKGELGRKAIKSQSAYMADCVNGKGVDRHFLGLRLLLNKNEEKPKLFSDPVFSQSCHWNLSTSQISSEYYQGYGWGEVVPDGYGIAYMVNDNRLQFNLVSLKLKNDHLRQYFIEALHEMRAVFEASLPPPKAKL
ncbi:acyltransferase ChoActase/COT/CPT [Gorgonomyces haynaldii]|nr:acyltransferase ChoActase/COT/CPT [Gorgonomyces haynaldii]